MSLSRLVDLSLSRRASRFTLAVGAALVLAACGGGGSSAPAAGGGTMAKLSGVAATGAGIANATVTAVNAQGNKVTTVTAADGSYSVDIAEAPPYVLSVKDAQGKAWYSYAAKAGVANITPLTTLAMLDANANKPLDALVAGWAAQRPSDAQILDAAKKVNANLAAVYQAYGVDPTKVNVFDTAFTANRQGLDAVLDAMKVSVDCTATSCAQTIKSPGGDILVSWNGNIATTGITLSWSGAGVGDAGGNVTIGLGSCKAPVAGTYSMIVQTTMAGMTVPEICIDNLPEKPASQTDFCGSSNVKDQMPQGVEMMSCTYDGTTGEIKARITQPMTIDYSIKYIFVKR